MEILHIAEQIDKKIQQLDKGKDLLENAAKEKARTLADYDLAIAKTLAGLKNGAEFELGGQKIKDPAISLAEKYARGICAEQKFDAEMAEGQYKAIITKLNVIMAQMNGYQSINRYLESSTRGD